MSDLARLVDGLNSQIDPERSLDVIRQAEADLSRPATNFDEWTPLEKTRSSIQFCLARLAAAPGADLLLLADCFDSLLLLVDDRIARVEEPES